MSNEKSAPRRILLIALSSSTSKVNNEREESPGLWESGYPSGTGVTLRKQDMIQRIENAESGEYVECTFFT